MGTDVLKEDNDEDSDDGSTRQAQLDRVEFAALYRSVYTRLALIATGIVGDRAYAEDIVQEAAIIALSKLDQFAAGTNFVAWMSAIVQRCALNYARKTKNRATFASDPQSLDHSESGTPQTTSGGSVVTDEGHLLGDQTEFDDQVVMALNSLGEETRCCVLLRTVLDLSYVEISELLGIPKGTAMSYVHRGKLAMRELLMSKCARIDGGKK